MDRVNENGVICFDSTSYPSFLPTADFSTFYIEFSQFDKTYTPNFEVWCDINTSETDSTREFSMMKISNTLNFRNVSSSIRCLFLGNNKSCYKDSLELSITNAKFVLVSFKEDDCLLEEHKFKNGGVTHFVRLRRKLPTLFNYVRNLVSDEVVKCLLPDSCLCDTNDDFDLFSRVNLAFVKIESDGSNLPITLSQVSRSWRKMVSKNGHIYLQ
jgi:hypothetical protein